MIMEDLPPQLIVEILSRLANSADLTRSRLTSKTLNSLSYDVTSITFLSYFDQYSNSRSQSSILPFKSIVSRSIRELNRLNSIAIGVDDSLQNLSYDDDDDDDVDDHDDLYLTDHEFVALWLPSIGGRVNSLSFCDFWVQSCWRKSRLLSLVSRHCQKLNELQVKKSWLSVDGLCAMSSLKCLTLESVRIDDANLSKVNECFPYLQTLNLIGVGGLKEPKICLENLKTCQWTLSNVPLSITIIAPKMFQLKLKCVSPRAIVLETPLMSDFHLSLEKANSLIFGELPCLKKLQLESSNLRSLIDSFPCSSAVYELTLEVVNRVEPLEAANPTLGQLFHVFPSLRSLRLCPSAYADMESSFRITELDERPERNGLKDFTAHLVVTDVEVTLSFISFIIGKCNRSTKMFLLIHHELDSEIGSNLTSRCVADFPGVQWKWGFWKAGCKDTWVSDSV